MYKFDDHKKNLYNASSDLNHSLLSNKSLTPGLRRTWEDHMIKATKPLS